MLAIAPSLIEPEDRLHHFTQTLKADRLGDVKVNDQRLDTGTERRARLHSRRHWCREGGRTARTNAAVQVDARRHRLDRRHVDMVVGVNLALVALAQRRSAVRALLRQRLDHMIGIGCERAVHPGPTFAALALALRQVRLLAGAWRQRGIVRRLGRLAQFLFQFGDALFEEGKGIG